MNSIEMTNNPSKNDAAPSSSSSLPQEFSFNSSSKSMKLTNHLRRFKFFGGAVMAIVMLVLLATVHSSTSLKAARANTPISLGQSDSDLVLNTKDAPTISLWSWGAKQDSRSDSSDDDAAEDETGEAGAEVADSSAALLTVVDGSNYAPVWKTIVGRTNRFAVFKKNAANPQKIDVALGSWNSINSDFQAQFPTTGEAVGFYVLGDKSITAVYEVVYLPSTSKLTAAQVLAAYGLPTNPKVLNAPGLPIANTIVVRNIKDITTTNLVLNSKTAGTVSLWWGSDEESESSDSDVEEGEAVETGEAGNEVVAASAALLTVVDGSNYAPVWKTLVARTNRFAVFRRNGQKVDVRLGAWNALISDFQAQFPTNEEAVGFFILGDKTATALYEVVFLPSTSKLTAAQVLANFGLPANPNVLNAPGLPVANTLVVRNLKDITTTNFILNAKAAGTVSLWWGSDEESESSDDDAAETEATEESEVADSSAALLTVVDGSAYAPVWKTLVGKTNRFAVFRKNAANPQKVDVRLGSWNSLISDFQAQFPALEGAVGFFILGDKTNTALYEVVFVPPNNSTTATQTLAAFGLPANPALLNAPGLPVANTLVIKSLKDISTSSFILNAKPAGTVSLWWGSDEESESSDSDVEEGEAETAEVVETGENGIQTLWGWSTSSSSSSIASDGSAYTDVWAALKAKTNRFVVFRQNANNSKLIDVDSGDWNTTFPQFASLFQVNKPQVGYIYLGTRNHEQLYEIVYCPTVLRTNPATVMVNFGLPPNPNKLTSFDLPVPYTFVATDKKQIDTGNVIMKAVAGGIIP